MHMMLKMDLDVLADDYYIQIKVDFETDEIKKRFLERIRFKDDWSEIMSDDHAFRRKPIGAHDVENCILKIEEIIQSFSGRTTSEIFEIVNKMDLHMLTILTVPID